MKEQLERIIREEIQPVLASHGGGAELVELSADNTAVLKLTGACSSCPGRRHTVEQFIEAVLREKLPDINKVVLQNQVDDELIQQALSIIRHK